MFIIREFAVCVLIVCMLGVLLLALWGIVYLLKTIGARTLKALSDRGPGLKLGVILSSEDITDRNPESGVVVDYSS